MLLDGTAVGDHSGEAAADDGEDADREDGEDEDDHHQRHLEEGSNLSEGSTPWRGFIFRES